jgi:hypothetical protein
LKRQLTRITFEGKPERYAKQEMSLIKIYLVSSLKQMGLVLLSSSTRPTTFQATTTRSRKSPGKTDVKKPKKKVPSDAKRAASTAAWTDYLGYATIAASAIGLVGIVWSSYQQK